MGKIVVTEFVSMDGVMEAPGGGEDFKYEAFAAAWPSRTGEFADRFNSMPKYVVSSTPRAARNLLPVASCQLPLRPG
jgi:hypothetical protein